MTKLPDWIIGWKEYTANLESPRIYSEWVAVSVIASALSRKVGLLWDRKLFPNFYIFLVGPPGARKGTALNPGRKMLSQINVPMAPAALTRRRFLSIMAASGAGGKSLSIDRRVNKPISEMTVFSGEVTVFINHHNFQLVKDLTDLFDTDEEKWRYETETQGADILINPFVNIIGGTQPGMLARMIPDEAVTIGFMSRVISVYEEGKERNIAFPQDIRPSEELESALLSDLREMREKRGWFKIDKSFRKVYENWYNNKKDDVRLYEERLSEYKERRQTHLLKLCMIMNISRKGNMVITEEDFNRAYDLLTRTEEKMSRTFAGMGRLEDADVMDAIFRFVYQNGKVKFSEIMSRFWREIDEKRVSTMIATWEKMGEVICKGVEGNATDALIVFNYDNKDEKKS